MILISKAKKRLEGVEDEHPRFGLHVELQRQDRVCSFLLWVLIVVIVDADVALAKGLATIPKTRLIGVWVGLDSVAKFQSRLQEQVDCGIISIPEDETRESVVRAKIREIVRDIEYGIVSGVFEFTILNDDPEDSLKQLRTAAEYSFK